MSKKKILLVAFTLFVIFLGILFTRLLKKPSQINPGNVVSPKEGVIIQNMKLTSSVFENQGMIPAQYACDGENVNPPLTISDVSENTQSLALIVDDPDAPGGTWTHWLLWNIDPNTKEIAKNSIPENSTQGINDFGKIEYGGPCPPSGTHQYQFRLYALGAKLNLNSGASRNDLESAIEGNVLEQSSLTGLYKRN